jgi:hypothetical protein
VHCPSESRSTCAPSIDLAAVPRALNAAALSREAKQRREYERLANPQPVPRSRLNRLKEAERRHVEKPWTKVRANRH